ncbi:MAG: catalase family peroxidase [Chitinophagaceae bacterium]
MNNPISPRLFYVPTVTTPGTLENTGTQSQTQNSSPAQLVDALHSAFGAHKARAVHAKGVITEGEFTPAPGAAVLTRAVHLQDTASKIIVRLSDFTGIPDIADNNGAANPRGFAIKFILPDGQSTDIVCHSFNGFPVENGDQFRELLLAIGASGPDAPTPNALDKFLATHPVAKTFLTTQKLPASYATISYFGVNSFKFTNKAGESHFIRYQFIPEEGEKVLTPDQFSQAGPQYLQTEIRERIASKSIRFKFYAEIAQDGDDIGNPSVAYPPGREKVLLGNIEIKKLADNSPDGDKALTFNPLNIPDGIETADPMLNLRGAAYPISVKERQ